MRSTTILRRACCAALAAAAVVASLPACAGAKSQITATGVEQPISFTPCVYAPDGTIFTAAPEDVLGHVKLERHHWAMFWRALDLGETTWDLGPELQEAIALHDGDAVVNLTIRTQSDPFIWYIAYWVPVLPDYVYMAAEADVVRVPGARAGR